MPATTHCAASLRLQSADLYARARANNGAFARDVGPGYLDHVRHYLANVPAQGEPCGQCALCRGPARPSVIGGLVEEYLATKEAVR